MECNFPGRWWDFPYWPELVFRVCRYLTKVQFEFICFGTHLTDCTLSFMKPVLSSQSAHSVFCTQSTFCTLFSPDLIPSGWLGSKHQLTTTTLCFLYAVHILYTLLPVRNLHSVPSVSCTLSTFHIVCTLFLSHATAHYTVSSNPNSAHSLSCTQSTFRTLCFLYAVYISHCVHSFPEWRH